jgi:hypothetical protein
MPAAPPRIEVRKVWLGLDFEAKWSFQMLMRIRHERSKRLFGFFAMTLASAQRGFPPNIKSFRRKRVGK